MVTIKVDEVKSRKGTRHLRLYCHNSNPQKLQPQKAVC